MADPRRLRRRTVLAAGAALAVATQLPKAAASAYPTFDLKADFGAAGNGSTNDTTAFQQAAAAIQAAGGGTLTIPAGVYVVGRQTHTSGVTPYWVMQPIFALTGVQFLHVKGVAGTVLRLAAGLRYGSFDPATGAPLAGITTDPDYGVEAGRMIEVLDGANLTIEDLELDGNNDQLVLGGEFGDTGRQLKATGIRLLRCTNVQITDVHSHHHGLDGVTIGHGGLTAADPPTPHAITRLRSEYNGRQGLSWTGGRGLTCTDSQFNHTGRGAVRSEPSAGVDIEAEDSVTRDGFFSNCEFVNNAGEGVNITHGDSGYTRFEGCTFWGTTERSVLVTKPGVVFKWSNIHGSCTVGYGSSDASLATVWGDCRFEDRPWTNGQVFRDGYLVSDAENAGHNARFADCTFVAREVRSIWTSIPSDLPAVRRHFVRCTFDHRHSALADGSYQTHPWGSRLVACTFTEAMGSTAKRWYIHLKSIVVEDDADGTQTVVTGPAVRWGNPAGPVGPIAEGTYG
ncbi:right-handed parallel beta-helix repeat-containing protein [Jiangella sp. DSM 45060]|uniref:right-handed parallel beta-helix repeat-containing protein n=1 Tax=Jiangella sp. DSM 45060 TaxID=1798224 RepID=UPI00087D4F23|nr:right-handed parallel beta-helix repeat-containing protein [Jiangella sp. DSM 45060]SDT19116.1 Pectate lyase superfamily protein [Jiangella sp. DSM 45060]